MRSAISSVMGEMEEANSGAVGGTGKVADGAVVDGAAVVEGAAVVDEALVDVTELVVLGRDVEACSVSVVVVGSADVEVVASGTGTDVVSTGLGNPRVEVVSSVLVGESVVGGEDESLANAAALLVGVESSDATVLEAHPLRANQSAATAQPRRLLANGRRSSICAGDRRAIRE